MKIGVEQDVCITKGLKQGIVELGFNTHVSHARDTMPDCKRILRQVTLRPCP